MIESLLQWMELIGGMFLSLVGGLLVFRGLQYGALIAILFGLIALLAGANILWTAIPKYLGI